jgi:hypothetical protein
MASLFCKVAVNSYSLPLAAWCSSWETIACIRWASGEYLILVTKGAHGGAKHDNSQYRQRLHNDHPQPMLEESTIIVRLLISGGNETLVCQA